MSNMSPGVTTREIDLVNVTPSVDSSSGGFVGSFAWGAVDDITTVSDKKRLAALFGAPNDENFVDWYSASNFLAYTSNLKLVRVVSSDAKNAMSGGDAVLIKNRMHFDGMDIASGDVAARYPGEIGNSIKVEMADSSSFVTWKYRNEFEGTPGTSDFCVDAGATNANDEVHVVVVDSLGLITGSPGSILEKYAFVSKAKNAVTADGEANNYRNVINHQSSYIWIVGAPSGDRFVAGGVIENVVAPEGVRAETTPTLSVSGRGTGFEAQVVMESTGILGSVNVLDAGTGYQVGDMLTVDGDGTGAAIEVVAVSDTGAIEGIDIRLTGSDYTRIDVDATSAGNGDAIVEAVVSYAIASIKVVSGGTGYDENTTISLDVDGSTQSLQFTVTGVGSDWGTAASGTTEYKRIQNGVFELTGGANGAPVGADELIRGWDLFADKETVDVSLLFSGDAGGSANSGAVIRHIIDNICEARKDVILFYSPDRRDVVNQSMEQATENVITFNDVKINRPSSYAIADSGWKYQYDSYADVYRWIPLCADIAGLAAHTDYVADPWYSPAGSQRGVIRNVSRLAFNPNKTARDELYKTGVNPVVTFRGEGTMLYGDRTRNIKSAAFGKINIRRLFIVLKKAIEKAAKRQLFELNDPFSRSQFRNTIEPFLTDVQSRRGIEAFKVVCDDSNNTAEVVMRSEFKAEIYIKPTYTTNFISLGFVAVRSDVEFEEVIGKF